MHWALDTFIISEDLPGRSGVFYGSQNPTMLRDGVWEYSKAIQLDGTTNYLTFPATLDPCYTDIRLCPKGFSAAMWVRVPSTATNAVFISNMQIDGTEGMGFSVGLLSSKLSCVVRDSTSSWTINTVVSNDVWIHIGVTWKAASGVGIISERY